ncbi:hypothetical protein ABZ639_24620 [Saccharomonospora sp. NPDC006951]
MDPDEFLGLSTQERAEFYEEGGAPPELSDEQVMALPASQREGYFQARGEAGIEGEGFFAWARRMGVSIHAGQQASDASQEQVGDLSSQDVRYVEGLDPSDHDYEGHDHVSMAQYLSTNLDPQEVSDISDAYHELHVAFREFAEDMKNAVSASQHEWEGDGAANAHGYFDSLSAWADGNSRNAQLASEVMYQQSEAAVTAKNSMPEEVPFDWDTEMEKWDGNAFSLFENIDNSMETFERSREAHLGAAEVMTQYDGDLYTAASKQPVFAEPPTFGSQGGHGDVLKNPGGDESTGTSGYSGNGVPGGGTPSGGAHSVPSGSASPGGVPGGLIPGGGTGPSGYPAPGTRPSGYRPPASSVPGADRSRANTPGFAGMGAVPAGGMSGGPGGIPGYNGKAGGGFGPGGTPGAGGGSGAVPGAAKPGAVPGAAVPAGAAGAAGRGGLGPMGGMGSAGRGGGKGGEDDEHQRPTYLVEGDPDDVFGTNQRTAPPVIGE